MTAADRARASREAQGLPPAVTDPAALARVVALLKAAHPKEPERGEPAA